MASEIRCIHCANQFWVQEAPTSETLCPGCLKPLGSRVVLMLESSEPKALGCLPPTVSSRVSFGIGAGAVAGPAIVLLAMTVWPFLSKDGSFNGAGALMFAVLGSLLGMVVGGLVGTIAALAEGRPAPRGH